MSTPATPHSSHAAYTAVRGKTGSVADWRASEESKEAHELRVVIATKYLGWTLDGSGSDMAPPRVSQQHGFFDNSLELASSLHEVIGHGSGKHVAAFDTHSIVMSCGCCARMSGRHLPLPFEQTCGDPSEVGTT